MKKSDVIQAIREATGLGAGVVSSVLSALEDVTLQRVAKGEEMLLPGLGRLEIKDRAARTGRNPRTGETFVVPASRRPAFKPTKALRDAAANSKELSN